MKKRTRVSFVFPLLSLLLTTSCEEDLTYVGIETPIVFALLDKTDSIHYVKITHSFSGDNNAIDVALIPDSSYYSEIDVKIEEWIPLTSNGSNVVKTRTWTLEDTVITNKEPGTFYAPDQKVYYFKTDAYNSSSVPDDMDTDLTVALKQSAIYKLVAVANGGEYTINSEISLVESFHVSNPSSSSPLSLVTSTANNVSYTDYHPAIQFNSDANSPKIVDAKIKVYFNEFFNDIPVEKSFVINIGERISEEGSSTSIGFDANGKTFYDLIKANATNDPSITKRQLDRIEIIMTGGSKELCDYILLSKPNTMVFQAKDFYTNITCSDGRQAIGIFASRCTTTLVKPDWIANAPTNRAITSNSVKILCTGSITGNLLFCSDNPLDANFNYSCQ